MEYKEYGSKNNDIVILLHGGGLSWWNYIDEISLLENEFHIVFTIKAAFLPPSQTSNEKYWYYSLLSCILCLGGLDTLQSTLR